MKKKLYFKVNTPQLLKEIADYGLKQDSMGVLRIPLNVLRNYLGSVAQRAAELNDPKLNLLMCEMALYEIANPESAEYDHTIFDKLKKQIKKQKS